MKTWREKLYENDRDEDNQKADRAVALIIEHCQEWIKACGGRVAWRGVRQVAHGIIIAPVRKDRRPLSSSSDMHQAFQQALGDCPAHRENSAFITGDDRRTIAYGSTYAAFPMGAFNFAWSPDVRDAYSIHTLGKWDNPEYKCNQDLPDALRSGHEIIVACEKILLVPAHIWDPYVKYKLKARGLSLEG